MRAAVLSRGLTGLLALLLLFFAAQTAHGQTDSTATAVPDSAVVNGAGGFTPPPAGLPSAEFETYNVDGTGVRYTAAITGLYTTGTVERVYFNTSHTGGFAVGHWQFPAALNYSYGRQDGALRERELLVLTTPDYRIRKWKFYALGEVETSNLRAIDRRVVAGGGVGYQLYTDTLSNEVAVSTFILNERTDYATEDDLQRHVVRNSTRLKLRLNRGVVSFSELLFYQPSLKDPSRRLPPEQLHGAGHQTLPAPGVEHGLHVFLRKRGSTGPQPGQCHALGGLCLQHRQVRTALGFTAKTPYTPP